VTGGRDGRGCNARLRARKRGRFDLPPRLGPRGVRVLPVDHRAKGQLSGALAELKRSCPCRQVGRGRPVAEGRVRPGCVVRHAPGLDHGSGMSQAREPLLVQTFIAEPPVEAFDEGDLHRFAGVDEVELTCSLTKSSCGEATDCLDIATAANGPWPRFELVSTKAIDQRYHFCFRLLKARR